MTDLAGININFSNLGMAIAGPFFVRRPLLIYSNIVGYLFLAKIG